MAQIAGQLGGTAAAVECKLAWGSFDSSAYYRMKFAAAAIVAVAGEVDFLGSNNSERLRLSLHFLQEHYILGFPLRLELDGKGLDAVGNRMFAVLGGRTTVHMLAEVEYMGLAVVAVGAGSRS
jgi:hypothetical protein